MEEKRVENNLKKNRSAGKGSYSYKYVDIAQIHEYLDTINARYIQQIQRIDGEDYIMTKRCFEEKWEDEWLQGCKVVTSTLAGITNPAQQQGSALTYARRYSLLMAFGLATEDDDARSLDEPRETRRESRETEPEITSKAQALAYKLKFGKHAGRTMKEIVDEDSQYVQWLYSNDKTDSSIKRCIELIRKGE